MVTLSSIEFRVSIQSEKALTKR